MADIAVTNAVVAGAKNLNELVAAAKSTDPNLAQGILGNATKVSTTQAGVITTAAVTWASTHYGLGLSSDAVTLVTAASMVVAGAAAHWIQVALYRRSLFGPVQTVQPQTGPVLSPVGSAPVTESATPTPPVAQPTSAAPAAAAPPNS